MSLLVVLVLLLSTIPIVLALMRANELFFLRYRRGELRVVRGRIPQALLNDFADILRGPGSEAAEGAVLRGVVADKRLQVYTEGALTAGQRQQVRNVIAGWPVAKIRNAPRS